MSTGDGVRRDTVNLFRRSRATPTRMWLKAELVRRNHQLIEARALTQVQAAATIS